MQRLARSFAIARLLVVIALLSTPSFGEQSADQNTEGKTPDKRGTGEADSFIVSNSYVHNWIKLPVLTGNSIRGEKKEQRSIFGIVDVIIFVASYCVPCQQLTGYIRDLEQKYEDQNVRFTWVFAQDLAENARGFAEKYRIEKALVADDRILKAWKNPELPSLFVGDRYGWLLALFPSATPREIKEVDRILAMTASF